MGAHKKTRLSSLMGTVPRCVAAGGASVHAYTRKTDERCVIWRAIVARSLNPREAWFITMPAQDDGIPRKNYPGSSDFKQKVPPLPDGVLCALVVPFLPALDETVAARSTRTEPPRSAPPQSNKLGRSRHWTTTLINSQRNSVFGATLALFFFSDRLLGQVSVQVPCIKVSNQHLTRSPQ